MKSSSGKYWIGLDHVRALAVYLVFVWHFIKIAKGHLAPPPWFPFSLLTEGHTGVGLFMVLSGYLFARLLEGKRIATGQFLWNRALRLLPLLFVVILAVWLENYLIGEDLSSYWWNVLAGVVKPTLPNGGWSITIEFHFYLLLPAILFLSRRGARYLVVLIVLVIGLRWFLHAMIEQVQTLAYWTIVGRLDQFLAGILVSRYRSRLANRHLLASAVFISFAAFYWFFDSLGGFYASYPSPSPIWIYLTTIEGVAYAVLVGWYDTSFDHGTGRLSKFVAAIGSYSYSIYLLQFFVVFRLANAIDRHLIDLSELPITLLLSIPCFLLMVPIGYLSFRWIETPFLRFRTSYLLDEPVPPSEQADRPRA